MLLDGAWTWVAAALTSLTSLTSPSSLDPSSPLLASNLSQPFMIAVEGNIASGKSTFLSLLSAVPGVATYPEPVERWRAVGGQDLFQAMMDEPLRWMHTFQLYSSLTRLETAYAAATPGAMAAVVERSLYSERYCFVQSMAEGGLLSPGEFAILDNTFNMLTGRADPALHIDLIVYIESEPEVLMRRVQGRAREGEQGLTREYLQEVHDRHQAWLDQGAFPLPAPVVRLNGNLELGAFKHEVAAWLTTLPSLMARE